MNSTEFDGISLTIAGSVVATGSLSITENVFSIIIVLKEKDCQFENPLKNDMFLINPLSDPYIVKNQYHLIDTAFYSDFTIIESLQEVNDQRICFLGSNQKSGLSVIFPNIENLRAFYDKFCEHVTVIKRGVTKIVAQYPSYYPDSDYIKKRKNLKNDFFKTSISQSQDLNLYIQCHSNLLSQINPDFTIKNDYFNDDIPFDSINELKKYVKTHQIQSSQKAKVLSSLLGININNFDKRLIKRYQSIKNQWKKIHYSQYKRTSIFKEHISQLTNYIYKFKQKLLTVVYDFSIMQITFNIIMSISQVYYDFHSHYNELLYIIRVFYRIFVKDVVYDKEKADNDEPSFVINDETILDYESFEALIFWIMLVFIEKGRIKQTLANVDSNDFESITIMISDFLFVADPILFYSYLSQNSNKIMELIPEITMGMSSSLSLYDCSDLWIAGLSADNISQFFNFYLIIILLKSLSIDMITDSNKQNQIIIPIQKSLQSFDHWEIISSAYKLQEIYPDLMKQKISTK